MSEPRPRIPRILVVDTPRMAPLIQRMLQGRYDVVCAHDAVEALAVSKRGGVDAVVAEMNVHGSGLRLFELMDMSVQGRRVPFILTCIRPSGDLVGRLQAVGVDEVLVKPFAPSQLIDRLGAALKQAQPPPPEDDDVSAPGVADQIRSRMKSIDGLPPFPATHAEVMRLANSDDSDSEDLAEQIQMDPNFLATVLKLANSSSYGFRRKVDSLKLAVTLLGFKEIANLVMSLQVFQQLGNYKEASRFDRHAFWQHSVGTAFIARTFAQKMQAEVELCFMAGLLHDIGKVVLDRFFHEFFSEVIETVQEREVPSLEVEDALLGVTHAHVGGYLASEWQFADTLTEAIVCHHNPSLARHYVKLSSIVHLANAVAYQLGYGSSGEAVHQESDDDLLVKAMWKVGLGPNTFGRLVELGKEQLEGADEFLAVLSGATAG